jgi:hypothetical protein
MNRGAAETAAAIARRGLSVNAAAVLMKTDGGNLSRLLREEGGRKPGRALAKKIRDEFGVDEGLWDEKLPDPEQPAQPTQPTGTEDA